MLLFNESRNDVTFKEMVIKALKFLKSKQNYHNFCDNMMLNTYSSDLSQNSAIIFFNQYVDSILTHYKEILNNYLLQANQIGSQKLILIANEYIDFIGSILEKDFVTKLSVFSIEKKFTQARLSKNAVAEEIELKEKMQADLEAFRDELKDIKKFIGICSESQIKNDISNISIKMQEFVNFVLKLDDAYTLKKKEEKSLDFNDLEHYTLQILENEKIRNSVKQRYKYVCVDEYQDTNEIQEKILSYISSDNNLFMVGDMKQSIYGFRECRPEILTDKFKLYQRDLTKGNAIKLNKNFRSEIDILNFSNYLFSNIMKEDSVGLDYGKESKFIFGGTVQSKQQDKNVFVKIIQSAQKSQEDYPKIYNKFSAKLEKTEYVNLVSQAIYVANEIENLLTQTIYDVKIQDYRKIRYKDIAILSRKGVKISNVLTEIFRERGIPFSANISSNIFRCYENSVIFNLLKLICNMDDDIALTSVLSSFLYNVSYDDIIKIKSNDKNMFYSLVEQRENDGHLSNIINKLFDDIEYLKNEFINNNILVAFNETLSHYNIMEYLAGLNSYEKVANMQLFIENIKEYSYLSLYEYVAFVENSQLEKLSTSSVVSGDDSVTIMTIHGSKGLEFPITFLINANEEFKDLEARNKLIKNQELGFAFCNYDEESQIVSGDFIKKIFQLANKQKLVAEDMRLLYVALTRAKNKLFIVGSGDVSKYKALNSSFDIMKSKSYLDWILGGLNENQLEKLSLNENLVVDYLESKFYFEQIDSVINETNSHYSYGKNLTLNEDNLKYILNTKQGSNVMLKNTVTAIMNVENENVDYNIKDFVYSNENKNDDDFLLIGTLYHLVMEKIDFLNINNKQDVDKFLEYLVSNNLVNNEQIKLVDSSKILKACLFLKGIVDSDDIVKKEKTFMLQDNANLLVNTKDCSKVLVQGIIDFYVIKKDCIYLVDYKTTKSKTTEFLASHYATQLSLYAKALQEFYNKPVYKKIIYSFYFDKAIIV